MASPSIIPNDRLDKDFYFSVLEDYRSGAAFRETDEDHRLLDADRRFRLRTVADQVLRVVAVNPAEGWSCATPARTLPARELEAPGGSPTKEHRDLRRR